MADVTAFASSLLISELVENVHAPAEAGSRGTVPALVFALPPIMGGNANTNAGTVPLEPATAGAWTFSTSSEIKSE